MTTLDLAGTGAPDALRDELDREAAEVRFMSEQSVAGETNHLSKMTRESYHRQNRKRGRRSP